MNNFRIVYVDDEVHQHIGLESLLPDDFKLHCFSSPIEALENIKDIDPSIIISDQRMPHMQGFKFLELTKSIVPNAIRIITTGYSDENSIVESIRKAQVFDYIIKPWDTEKLLASIERAFKFYESEFQRVCLSETLKVKNEKLQSSCNELNLLLSSHMRLEAELQSWVHPFVLWAAENNVVFPIKRNLAGLVMDIINSSNLHGQYVGRTPVRVKVLQTAWEVILKHGGEVESQEGDKIYANFGLTEGSDHPTKAAFAAAQELRSSIKGITDHYDTEVECGIAVHEANDCNVFLREAVLNTENGVQTRRKFDTSSIDIDLAHRLEAITHFLPGSNIIFTRNVLESIQGISSKGLYTELGHYQLKGQQSSNQIFLLKSNKATDKDIEKLKSEYLNQFSVNKKSA